MEFNEDLFNAAIVGENPEESFIVENNRLHAVEQHIADLKKNKSSSEVVLPLMRKALQALIEYANGKVPHHFTENAVSLKPNEKDQLIEKIVNIYQHLPHQDRLALSSLIHHKQGSSKNNS